MDESAQIGRKGSFVSRFCICAYGMNAVSVNGYKLQN